MHDTVFSQLVLSRLSVNNNLSSWQRKVTTLSGVVIGLPVILGAATVKAALSNPAALPANPAIHPDATGSNGSFDNVLPLFDLTNTVGKVDSPILKIANQVLGTVTLLAGIAAVGYLIYAGILYITAGGNQERTKQARAGIVNAIIGIAIIVAAYAIIRFAIGLGLSASSAATNL